jgi:hypothetical protein
MKCLIDTHDKGSFPEQELTEEQFFEQFAALEDGLALLQIHMRGMSDNARLFGSLARHMRRSICPAALSPEIRHVTGVNMRTAQPVEAKSGVAPVRNPSSQ